MFFSRELGTVQRHSKQSSEWPYSHQSIIGQVALIMDEQYYKETDKGTALEIWCSEKYCDKADLAEYNKLKQEVQDSS